MDFPPPLRLDGEVPAYAPTPQGPPPGAPARRGVPFALVGVLVAVALVAVALLVFNGRKERSAEDRLESAQAFVAGVGSVHVDYDVEATISAGDPDSRVSSVSTERMGGSVDWTPDAWRVHQESRYGEDETILVGDSLYMRSSFDGSTLEDELWYETEWSDPTRGEVLDAVEAYADLLDDDELLGGFYDDDSLGVMMGGSIYISGLDRTADLSSELIDDPIGFADAIKELSEPTIGERNGDLVTMRATLRPPADLVEAFGRPIPDGAVQIDLDADDIPQAMRLEVTGGASRFWIELRFAGWGDGVAIAAPSEDEIESFDDWSDGSRFGEVYEAPEVTPVEGLVPVRPNDSLGSWRLEYADAYDNYFSDDPECENVAYLSWFLEGSDDEGWGTYVHVDLMTRSCAQRAADDLGLDPLDIEETPAPGSVKWTSVDEFTWVLMTSDTAALVTIDTDDDSLPGAIIDSMELVDWATVQQHADGAGF